MSGSRTWPPLGPGYERFQQSCPCWEFPHLHCKIAISGPGSKISNNFIGSKLGHPGLAWEREARPNECCWQAWEVQQVLLLMLGMQVSTGFSLEYWERCKSCKSCTSWERCEPSKICESCECCECCKSYKSRIHSWQPIAQLE